MSEAAELARCRDRLAAIAPGQWTRVHDHEGCFVEARGEMGELLPVFRFSPGATEAEICFAADAPSMVRFLLGLVDRAIESVRAHGRNAPSALACAGAADDGRASPPKDYTTECAMRCAEPAFKRFLMDRHGLESPASDERGRERSRFFPGMAAAMADQWGGFALVREAAE